MEHRFRVCAAIIMGFALVSVHTAGCIQVQVRGGGLFSAEFSPSRGGETSGTKDAPAVETEIFCHRHVRPCRPYHRGAIRSKEKSVAPLKFHSKMFRSCRWIARRDAPEKCRVFMYPLYIGATSRATSGQSPIARSTFKYFNHDYWLLNILTRSI